MILTKDCEDFKTVKGHETYLYIQVNSTTENPRPVNFILGHLEIKDTGLAGHCAQFSPNLTLTAYMYVISPNSNREQQRTSSKELLIGPGGGVTPIKSG